MQKSEFALALEDLRRVYGGISEGPEGSKGRGKRPRARSGEGTLENIILTRAKKNGRSYNKETDLFLKRN